MRKILFLLLTVVVMHSFAQTHSLVSVLLVKPKPGQAAAFETAWKAHLLKFHQKDTSNRRGVYEVLSGIRTGSYYITSGGMSWSDFDVERTTDKTHDLDYAMTVTSKLESESGDEIYRLADTLSYRPEVQATKYVFNIYHIKTGKQNDVTSEIKRAIAVNTKINSPVSYSGYIHQLTGSQPVIVMITNLKDGFKQMDPDYFKGLTDKFRETYIEMYGQAAWDKRMTFLADNLDLLENEIVKLRADLSSGR